MQWLHALVHRIKIVVHLAYLALLAISVRGTHVVCICNCWSVLLCSSAWSCWNRRTSAKQISVC